MINEKRLERILDKLEDIAEQVACMVCSSTISREHHDQLEDALQLIRNSYIVNVEQEITEEEREQLQRSEEVGMLTYKRAALLVARDSLQPVASVEPMKTDLETIDIEIAKIDKLLEDINEDS